MSHIFGSDIDALLGSQGLNQCAIVIARIDGVAAFPADARGLTFEAFIVLCFRGGLAVVADAVHGQMHVKIAGDIIMGDRHILMIVHVHHAQEAVMSDCMIVAGGLFR